MGFLSFAAHSRAAVPNRFRDWLRSLLPWSPDAPPRDVRHPFDVLHRVDTSGLLYADKLASGHPHDQHNEGYYATAPSLFRGLMAQWQATLPQIGFSPRDYSFIDLGCGKGRALMLASEVPFRSVLGVELNRRLVKVAQRNLARWLHKRNRACVACPNIAVRHADALSLGLALPLPAGPVLLFLFNPFQAEVMSALLDRIAEASRTRSAPIDLLYVHPDHDALVARTPGIELLQSIEIPFNYEDTVADIFSVSYDLCSIYRLSGAAKVS
jgi:SAM-dependent methyltransferase